MSGYSQASVESAVRRLFGAAELRAIVAELNRYAGDTAPGRARVQLAILKSSGGSRRRLAAAVERACRDFRDVVAEAEYPEASRAGAASLPESERDAIRQRDLAQYVAWLEAVGVAGVRPVT